MELAYIILIILALVYIPIWVWVWRFPDKAERFHLSKYGPCILIKTQLGMKTMDRLAKYPRFWRAFGFMSKVISAVLFLLMMYMLIVALLAVPSRMASGSSIGIEYALAIPGFNPILPLSYGVVALVIAMVVHELGHGIQARANGARVDSSGLMYGVVPLGAFVEPNEDDMSKKSRRAQMDMYTAGISVNTVVAVVSILIMIGACGTITTDYGDEVGVYSMDGGSPSELAGIPLSAILTDLEDPVTGELIPISSDSHGSTVSVVMDGDIDLSKWYKVHYIIHGEGKVSDPIQFGVYIRAITVGSPAQDSGIEYGQFLESITFDDNGNGIRDDEAIMFRSSSDFSRVMEGTEPGVTAWVGVVPVAEYGSEVSTEYYRVVLDDRNGRGFLGLSVSMSGMILTTPDIMMDKAADPFYGADSAFSYVTSFFGFLSGPFNGADPVPDAVKWWYNAPIGDVFWVILSLLYWIFWLDILLAISNALPAYPFDGGFIFAGGVSWFCEKVGIRDEERRDRITNNVSSSVSTVVLFMFIIVILSFLM